MDAIDRGTRHRMHVKTFSSMKINDSQFASSSNGGLDGALSSLNYFAARLSARDAEGHVPMLLKGNETDAELRSLALSFVDSCPANCEETQCPFRVLKSLYHVSLKALINSMSHAGLLSLFETGGRTRDCTVHHPEIPFVHARR